MKKLMYTLALIITLGLNFNIVSAAEKAPKPANELSAEQQLKFDRIRNRVEEIRNMDKSNLSQGERKELRKELREMKNQARAMKGGVYLSVGAIIVIILLLILIL